ncbi:hypothetical protein [Lewinella sp. LCG006]|uniref:hypothetical protein n=1 Tax=Lewinella sp. LCG006 TaxID=3231911 RepID=UPI00346048DD
MHYFEEEYQKRFKEGQSTEGVDSDQLWANIESALPPENKRRGGTWVWVCLVLLFGILAGSYYFYSVAPKEINNNTDATAILGNEAVHNTDELNPTTAANVQMKTYSSLDVTHNKEEFIISTQNDGLTLPLPTKDVIAINEHSRSNPTTVSPKKLLAPIENSVNIYTSISVDKHEKKISPTTSAEATSDTIATSPVVAKLFVPLAGLVKAPRAVVLPAIVLPSPIVVGQTKALPPSLGFFSGISYWEERSTRPDSPFSQQLDGLLKSETGLSTAMEIRLPLSPSIDLISGFHYNYSRAVFEYSRSWDTVMYRNNVPGAELINALGFREVKHHNSLQTLTIPLFAGWSSKGKRMQIGVNAGVGLNLLLETTGRSLNASGEVFTFNATNTPYPDIYLSYHVQPQLSYPLGKQFRLHFRPGISYHILGVSDVYEIRRTALRTDWSLGLSWRRK